MSAPTKLLFSSALGRQTVRGLIKREFSTETKSELVRVSKQDKLYLIGINRPEKRNCVNSETASQLKRAFEDFSSDSNAYAAVLYGVGGTFCAGYDLKEISTANVQLTDDGPMGPTRMFLRKPVVAAIDGHAVAGGMELALWCDLRVMEEPAKMGVYCRRFGVPLIDGGTVRLPKLIGLARALDLILTGRGINGKEAFDMGLVTKLCKKGEALKVAVELAQSLCDFPQECLRVDRESSYKATFGSSSLEEALKMEYQNGVNALPEAVKGAANFVQGFGRHGSKPTEINNSEKGSIPNLKNKL
ncbi:hypothetical protein JTE90_016559 [Oedothorax gibbosus]|uniref:Uncharacterized protein n=1 Tax=Oedothorax gibbosus TaxID=931172 RepID=A0AAV6UE37_9ARAC|nr:hypothetical protein JTE90_016559 [Oedothorax gibbosus]